MKSQSVIMMIMVMKAISLTLRRSEGMRADRCKLKLFVLSLFFCCFVVVAVVVFEK